MKTQSEIIYEDDGFSAFNKPCGVNFDWALETRPRLIPVHRLDKGTSGVILFAKNQNTADYLKNLFRFRQIKKTYTALVVGSVKKNLGVIDLPIGRSAKDPTKRIAKGKMRGTIREAETEFRVLKRFPPTSSKSPAGKKSDFFGDLKSDFKEAGEFFPVGGFTLIEAYPKTGRTHQIRSHFAAIGHPVVCDKLYAGKKLICPGGLERQFLHASALEFTLLSGGRLKLEADLPEDLDAVLKNLKSKGSQ